MFTWLAIFVCNLTPCIGSIQHHASETLLDSSERKDELSESFRRMLMVLRSRMWCKVRFGSRSYTWRVLNSFYLESTG
jgi:hypothetical protein